MQGETTQDVVQHDIKARTGALQLAPVVVCPINKRALFASYFTNFRA